VFLDFGEVGVGAGGWEDLGVVKGLDWKTWVVERGSSYAKATADGWKHPSPYWVAVMQPGSSTRKALSSLLQWMMGS